MTGRDVQRGKVYAAESLVRRVFDRAAHTGCHTLDLHGSRVTLPVERRFASIESLQAYADAVLALGWVRADWPRATRPVHMRARNGQARAHYEPATETIAIPPHEDNRAWAMREFVILHELAHHLESDPTQLPHGPGFVDRLTRLVTEIIGPEAGLLMRSIMHSEGVAAMPARHNAYRPSLGPAAGLAPASGQPSAGTVPGR